MECLAVCSVAESYSKYRWFFLVCQLPQKIRSICLTYLLELIVSAQSAGPVIILTLRVH
jgi:hypothetical protein